MKSAIRIMPAGMPIAAAASLLIGSTLLGACAAKSTSGLRTERVTAADFSRPDAAGSESSTEPASIAHAAAALHENPPAPSTQAAATGPAHPIPPPAAPPVATIRAGQPVIIDSLIGQVSGRPIFADALLDPVADQLRREREQLSQADFIRKAKTIVDGQLLETVRNELFLAEAEASLTQQQKQGLLAFLNNFREKTLAESLGSLSRRQQELQQEEGMTVDQFVDLEKNKLLIGTIISQKVSPRVLVSWKDVEREYERRKAEFNPPATVTLKILRLSNVDKAEVVEQVKQRFAAGETFDDVVTALSLRVNALDPQAIPSGDPSDAQIAEAYKPHLKGLKQGQTTDGFIVKDATRDDTVWIHIEKIEQPPPRTLYDVQRELANELNFRRNDEERAKYIKSLFDKGIYSELDEMSRRVLTVALMRYGQ